MTNKRAGYLKQDEAEALFKAWDLPYMEDQKKQDPTKTNAINKTSDWKYEPPEPEEEITLPTAEEVEAIRQAAYQEGFESGKTEGFEKGQSEGHEQGVQQGQESGYAEGHEQGLASGSEEIQQQLVLWQQLTQQLTEPVAKVENQLEKELVKLAVSLARSVIRTEIQTNQDIIFQALSEGLKVLPIQEQSYQIHLNPEDIQLIKQHFAEEEIEKHKWHFIESPEMQRGGCDIVTNSNAVDVSIERRTREVLDKFLLEQGLAQGEGQED